MKKNDFLKINKLKNKMAATMLLFACSIGGYSQATIAAKGFDWNDAATWTNGVFPTENDEITFTSPGGGVSVRSATSAAAIGASTTNRTIQKFIIIGASGGVSRAEEDATANLEPGVLTFKNANFISLNGANTPTQTFTFGVGADLSEVTTTALINKTSGSAVKRVNFDANSKIILPTNKTGITIDAVNNVLFNGKIIGEGSITVSNGSIVEFGSSSNFSEFTSASIDITGNSNKITVNGDLPSIDMFVGASGTSKSSVLTIKKENITPIKLTTKNSSNLTLDVDANQSNLGQIFMIKNVSTFICDVDPAVTQLAFDDCSSRDSFWEGSLQITGFKPGVIRFGTDQNGLTASQLAKITADGDATGKELALDSNGYLILAPLLKVDDNVFDDNSIAIYRNHGVLFVNSGATVIQNIRVFNIQGQLVAEQKNVQATSSSIANLKSNQILVVQITSEDGNVISKKTIN